MLLLRPLLVVAAVAVVVAAVFSTVRLIVN